MKKISMIGISFLAMIAVVTVMFFNSCTDDPCKDVNCGANGNCVDGTCVCDAGYEGTGCDVEVRAKFIGTYTVSGAVTCPVTGGTTFTNESMVISNSSGSVEKIVITFVGTNFTATVNGTSFTLDNQTIQGFDYTGSGSISGNNLSITINEFDGSIPETCIYTLSGPKQ